MKRLAGICVALIMLCALATPAYGGARSGKALRIDLRRPDPDPASGHENHLGGSGRWRDSGLAGIRDPHRGEL